MPKYLRQTDKHNCIVSNIIFKATVDYMIGTSHIRPKAFQLHMLFDTLHPNMIKTMAFIKLMENYDEN